MTSEHIKFFGLSEDKMYYDEKKKRFVNTNDVPLYIERAYKNSHFKDVSTTCSFETDIIILATTRSIWIREQRILDKVEAWTITNPSDELLDQT